MNIFNFAGGSARCSSVAETAVKYERDIQYK